MPLQYVSIQKHVHFQGSLERGARGEEVWEAIIFILQGASQNCGGHTRRQPLLSHPRLEKHKPPTPSWSTVLGSVGTAHTSDGGRDMDMGWGKPQGMQSHRATPKDEASVGHCRRGCPPGFRHPGFVPKNCQVFWLKFTSKISLTQGTGEEVLNLGSDTLSEFGNQKHLKTTRISSNPYNEKKN